MYRIFLVEDDYSLAQAMKKQLENDGNEVLVAQNFRDVSGEFETSGAHLVLLDVTLPYKNGYHWCNEIRKKSEVPIVFVSSAAENMNIVMAINVGADDFIIKPVEPMVLTAKVQAILRRSFEMQNSNVGIEFHGAILNPLDETVSWGNECIELTKNEFRIMMTLLEKRGKIVSRQELMMKLWQNDLYVEENTLTVNVGRLRKKLEDYGLSNVITTRSGSGYMIV